MPDNPTPDPNEALTRIVASAQRLGVELDEADALQWLTAMAARDADQDVVVDIESGTFGHQVAMLDFNPAQLARFREIGRLVELPDRPGVVETALALSGSAAQSKVQAYPGDADYFERVNIMAATHDEACRILADLMREKVLATAGGPSYRFSEAKLGSYPADVVRAGKPQRKGNPISWSLAEVQAGEIAVTQADGSPGTIRWDAAALDPGWCKMDWIVADPARGQLSNASNMLDVTWEAPDGAITPLDGYLDAYFQEIYLDADSVPLFSKLVRHVSPDALGDYVAALEHEVGKYLNDPNYGKAARRMYNVFRLTGQYAEAAFLRELFDEPATVLYQVWSLIRTMDEATMSGSEIPIETVSAQADHLILAVVQALEGDAEAEIVRALLRLRGSLAAEKGPTWEADMEAARAQVINIVNTFFHDRLTAVPEIKAYMDRVGAGAHQ